MKELLCKICGDYFRLRFGDDTSRKICHMCELELEENKQL